MLSADYSVTEVTNMEIVSMKCPNCGSLVYFEKGQDRCFCSHCGSQLQFSDPNNKKFTYTKIDAARIREAQTRESIRQRELDIQERQLNKERNMLIVKTVLSAIAIIAVAAVVIYIIHLVQSDKKFGFGFGMFMFFVGIPIVIAIAAVFSNNNE